jgi:uncharacterized protein (TIGR02118 family)
MAAAKLTVIYPVPKDINAFERQYNQVHVPMAVEKLSGKTKIVVTKISKCVQSTVPFHRIAEVHFPSMAALEACLASPGGRETAAHAISISSGGSPIILIGEEETFTF